jgi:hypothetical protein
MECAAAAYYDPTAALHQQQQHCKRQGQAAYAHARQTSTKNYVGG